MTLRVLTDFRGVAGFAPFDLLPEQRGNRRLAFKFPGAWLTGT
jgi:hypothetical protein